MRHPKSPGHSPCEVDSTADKADSTQLCRPADRTHEALSSVGLQHNSFAQLPSPTTGIRRRSYVRQDAEVRRLTAWESCGLSKIDPKVR